VQALNQIHQRCHLVIEDILCSHFHSRLFVSKTLIAKIANPFHQLSALEANQGKLFESICIDCEPGNTPSKADGVFPAPSDF